MSLRLVSQVKEALLSPATGNEQKLDGIYAGDNDKVLSILTQPRLCVQGTELSFKAQSSRSGLILKGFCVRMCGKRLVGFLKPTKG